ncbi:MAG TPA: tetratricopeptide repeat protein [Allosphingosinicella sp.]
MVAAACLGLASLLLPGGTAQARANEDAALAAYVQARVADSEGDADLAAQRFAAALALAPDDEMLAARALSQAVAAGNEGVALTAARTLERLGKLTPEGRLLLLAEALKARRWPAAETQAAELEKDDVFSFMAPILRAWTVAGSGKGDALALLAPGKGQSLSTAYAAEQRPLVLLLQGRRAEGVAALAPLLQEPGAATERLRVAAAATLARRGGRDEALALLDGGGEAAARARAAVAAGKRLPGGIDSPAAGVADFLVRIASDLSAQQVPELALSFARLAAFAAPENSEAWLLAGDLLGAKGRYSAALAAVGRVAADDPFAGEAAERRLRLLAGSGRTADAIAQGRAAAEARPDAESWTRLGGLLTATGRFDEAAQAFGRALALRSDAKAEPEWALRLLQGTALTRAGKWAEGREALRQAYRLAPEQPTVLNVLGYSQLERRENLAEAERLIGEANKLQPDDSAITDSLGWTYYVKGELPRAVELLERAARGQPADAAINEHLGDAYYSAGRRYEARYAWRAALVYAEGGAADRLRAKIDGGLRPELAAP